jgi:hypothetical protein
VDLGGNRPGPLSETAKVPNSVIGHLLVLLVEHLLLTALPGVAAALGAARLGQRSIPLLLAISLVVSGAAAMLAFWAFYLDPLVGQTWDFLALFGSVALIVWALWGGKLERELLRELATPLALWGLGSAFLVFFGFLHGGAGSPLAVSATRFTAGSLPSDNDVPLFFAEWFFHHGHSGTPPSFPGGWLASDRPPLQIGYVLSQRETGWDATGLHYQVLGVVLQQLWIVGLWALLIAARVGRTTRALTMVAVLLSDLAIVNGFYVWPKMLPAAMLLAAAAIVLTPLWPEVRRNAWVGALVGALFGLAMLGHGSSVFGVVPLAIVAAWRGLPSLRWLGVGLLAGIVLMAPWSAYQKYDDPPGNRLTKWMLAGAVEIDSRTTSQAILDSYGEAGLGGALHNKAENFAMMVGGGPALKDTTDAASAVGSGDFANAVRDVRTIFFFYLLPSLGLLVIAPFAMLLGRRRRFEHAAEWNLAVACFAVVIFGGLCWGLLLFGTAPARASIHIGSLALPALALCACVSGLSATYPRVAAYIVGASVLISLALYAPVLEPQSGTSYSPVAALIALASLVGFGWMILRDTDSRMGKVAGGSSK